jgi:ubiquitin carboxyl-terminal hydrolase 5/13
LECAGVDGGFQDKPEEYDETYSIYILPDFVELPYPDVNLPEKVCSCFLVDP